MSVPDIDDCTPEEHTKRRAPVPRSKLHRGGKSSEANPSRQLKAPDGVKHEDESALTGMRGSKEDWDKYFGPSGPSMRENKLSMSQRLKYSEALKQKTHRDDDDFDEKFDKLAISSKKNDQFDQFSSRKKHELVLARLKNEQRAEMQTQAQKTTIGAGLGSNIHWVFDDDKKDYWSGSAHHKNKDQLEPQGQSSTLGAGPRADIHWVFDDDDDEDHRSGSAHHGNKVQSKAQDQKSTLGAGPRSNIHWVFDDDKGASSDDFGAGSHSDIHWVFDKEDDMTSARFNYDKEYAGDEMRRKMESEMSAVRDMKKHKEAVKREVDYATDKLNEAKKRMSEIESQSSAVQDRYTKKYRTTASY